MVPHPGSCEIHKINNLELREVSHVFIILLLNKKYNTVVNVTMTHESQRQLMAGNIYKILMLLNENDKMDV